ncbi:MAG: hypothetical protein JWM95_2801 [Gemmatimonadetes bacterium]|nr:hypothetical protein [Gemmatimonadota bacterium]
MEDNTRKAVDSNSGDRPSRQCWEVPRLEKLPALTELTLVTGGPIGGGGGGGGTVF